MGFQVGPWKTKSQEKIISSKFQPQELVTTKHLACKCTCHRSSNYFLTRSFSSVLVDCLQSGCQTVEPGKKQHTTKIKGNATKPQSCRIELLRTVHTLSPSTGEWIMIAPSESWQLQTPGFSSGLSLCCKGPNSAPQNPLTGHKSVLKQELFCSWLCFFFFSFPTMIVL